MPQMPNLPTYLNSVRTSSKNRPSLEVTDLDTSIIKAVDEGPNNYREQYRSEHQDAALLKKLTL
jgi:hypothetical protein